MRIRGGQIFRFKLPAEFAITIKPLMPLALQAEFTFIIYAQEKRAFPT
jgi:hypothetical protein